MQIQADRLDLRDYIATFRNLLSIQTCQTLIEWAQTQPDHEDSWQGFARSQVAHDNHSSRTDDVRSCWATSLSETRGPCWNSIELALKHIATYYPYHHQATEHTGVQMIRYRPGQAFEQHVDSYGGAPRILSVSIALNDDFTGGALGFWGNQHTAYRMLTGDATVFPSNFCFPHQVFPVETGERYVLVTWLI